MIWNFCFFFVSLQKNRKCAIPRHNSSKLVYALGLLHFCKLEIIIGKYEFL